MRVPRLYIVTLASVVAAAIIVAYPVLVPLGFVAFIIPGLIMFALPTAAPYLAAAAALRIILPSRLGPWRTPAALAGAACLGVSVVQPYRDVELARFQAAILPDIIPNAPVPVSGNIVVQQSGPGGSTRNQRQPCDAFCAALLITPGVTSVTLAARPGQTGATTWRLVPRGSAPDLGLAPVRPEDLDWSNAQRRFGFDIGGIARSIAARKAVAASWALRLATQQTLVADQSAPVPDDTIIITDQQDGPWLHIERAELRDRSGALLFRRSKVTARLLARPLWFDLANAFDTDIHFYAARQIISNEPVFPAFDAIHELLQHVAIAGLQAAPDASGLLRQKLAAALDTPGEPAGLALAKPWIDSLGFDQVFPGDAALFRKIIGDLRIHDIAQAVIEHRRLMESCDCREVLVARVVAPETSAGDRVRLVDALVRLPPGTFAAMTDNERRIINDPALRQDAPAFIERLADAGKPALGTLMPLLRAAAQDPDLARQAPVVRAVRKGLARMGTQAADALPELRDVFKSNTPPAMQAPIEAFWWRVTMVRMGLPISDLTYPAWWSQQLKDIEQRRVIAAVADYQPGQ